MIKAKSQQSQLSIDLTGPQGNAFYLIGTATKLAKQLGLNPESIREEMMSGDYEQLLEVFDREFGSFVTLYR